MSPVAKMPETKVENKSSPAPVGKEAKSIDKSIKTEIDYAKIPISHYKRLIEGDFGELSEFYCFEFLMI